MESKDEEEQTEDDQNADEVLNKGENEELINEEKEDVNIQQADINVQEDQEPSKEIQRTEESKVQENSIELENDLEDDAEEEPFIDVPAPKSIGRRMKGDKIFDDRDGLKSKIPVKIYRIDVWQHEKSITGLQATYQLSDGSLLQGRLYLDLRAGEKEFQEPWVVEPDETIVKIVGRCSKEFGLEKLSIFTNKRCTHYGNVHSRAEEFTTEFHEKRPPMLLYGSRRVIRGKHHSIFRPHLTLILSFSRIPKVRPNGDFMRWIQNRL